MPTIIDGSGSADFQTPLPVSEGGTGSTVGAAYGRVVRTAGDITTTSTSLVDVTGATVTFTTGAFPVAYGVAQHFNHTTAGQGTFFNVDIDGVLQHGTDGIRDEQEVANYNKNASFSGQSAALTAGSHTIKEQWRTTAATATLAASANSSHLFYAHEVR